MYKQFTKYNNDYLAKAQAMPKNDTVDGNGGAFNLSGAMGSIEIIAQVNTAFAIASTKVVTVKLQDSADGITYADLVTLYKVTADGATAVAAETILGRYIVPNGAKDYIKAVLVTTDGDMVGKVDIFQNYLPR